jgi:hypothetical protein
MRNTYIISLTFVSTKATVALGVVFANSGGIRTAVLKLTEHAETRANARGIAQCDMESILAFGREVHTRGAVIYAVGRREVERAEAISEDISELEGWHIVCSRQGEIITVYKNRDLRGLRPRRRTRNDRFLRPRTARAA